MNTHIFAMIDQRHRWPLWRRWLRWPDCAALMRRKAWEALHKHVEIHMQYMPNSARPIGLQPGLGIFDTSRAPLHLLGLKLSHLKSFEMRDNPNVAPRLSRWPGAGPLVCAIKVDDFSCEITDVEGIDASKSSGLYFPDIHSFGDSFRIWKGFALDESGLAAALDHGEIRIIHAPGIDSFSLDLWDGRLFLDNAGGSHHFAAAAYLARELCLRVPLKSQLWLHSLNEPVWRALLDEFRVLLAPAPGLSPAVWIADLCGECHEFQLPPAIADGKLIFVPRRAPTVDAIAHMLQRARVTEVTAWWEQALATQHKTIAHLRRRWPELAALATSQPPPGLRAAPP